MIAKKVTVSLLLVCGVVLAISSSRADPKQKVTVCHVSGDSGQRETLEIAPEAVQAHLRHGDSLGACPTVTNTCDPVKIGNGRCEAECNNSANNWDGGDCCPGTCRSEEFPCGVDGFTCVAP